MQNGKWYFHNHKEKMRYHPMAGKNYWKISQVVRVITSENIEWTKATSDKFNKFYYNINLRGKFHPY